MKAYVRIDKLKLQAAMSRAGMTDEQLMTAARLDPQTLPKILCGEVILKPTAQKIANKLGCHVEDLSVAQIKLDRKKIQRELYSRGEYEEDFCKRARVPQYVLDEIYLDEPTDCLTAQKIAMALNVMFEDLEMRHENERKT